MATVTITTDVANCQAHDVYFELQVSDSATASYSALLNDFGKLKCEFDIPDSGQEVSDIGLKQSAIDVKIDNFLVGGSELIDVLEDAFTFSNEQWVAYMYVRDSGGTYGNPIPFIFSREEIKYDVITELIEFSFLPKNVNDTTVADLVGQIYEFDFISGIPATTDAIVAGEFIVDALEDSFAGTPVIDSDLTQGLPTTGDHWFVTKQIQASTSGNNTNKAMYHLAQIATFEGALFGSSYGGSFYIKRTSTANSVTLDTDDITLLKSDNFIEAQYRDIYLEQTPVNVEADSVNLTAEKSINIVFATDSFYLGTVGAELPPPYFREVTQIATDTSVITQGIEGYKAAFGFENNLIANVELWGIGTIYPYSTITFDGDAPSQFQGKNFRIKHIEYDFKYDKVSMRIYQV